MSIRLANESYRAMTSMFMAGNYKQPEVAEYIDAAPSTVSRYSRMFSGDMAITPLIRRWLEEADVFKFYPGGVPEVKPTSGFSGVLETLRAERTKLDAAIEALEALE
tara:strand:+ start:948 stop:1268 length:321 start_codon:yes stop_codon:yes gene_type:complete